MPLTPRHPQSPTAPVLPQPTRMIARFPITAQAPKVLTTRFAPAQMNLFQRPSANDPA
jgi:hypothetical protein